jgi:RNA binding exosome subunit
MEKRRLRKKPNTWPRLKKAILYVEISFFVHATENLQKTLKAVRYLLPLQERNEVSFTTENLWGHNKNPILLGKTIIKKTQIIGAFIESLYRKLDRLDKDELVREFHRRLDENKTFFLRLDKQKAYEKRIKLGNIDPILIKIKLNFFPNTFTEILNLKSDKIVGE